jgi:hypothetical protein
MNEENPSELAPSDTPNLDRAAMIAAGILPTTRAAGALGRVAKLAMRHPLLTGSAVTAATGDPTNMIMNVPGMLASYSGDAEAGALPKFLPMLERYMLDRFGNGAKAFPHAEAMAQQIDRLAPATFDVLRHDQLANRLGHAAFEPQDEQMLLSTPNQFKNLAYPREGSADSDRQVDALANMLRTRQSLPDAYGNDFYVKNNPQFEGLGDIPFLQYGDMENLPFGRITGHEGRHRMEAVGDVYGDNTPIAIRGYGYDPEDLKQATNSPFVLPESATRGLRLRYQNDAYSNPENQDFLGLFLEKNLRPLDNGYAGGGMIKKLPQAMSAMSDLLTHTTAPAGALSVVKSAHGQWLSNSVEDALNGLKKGEPFGGYSEDYKPWENAAAPDSLGMTHINSRTGMLAGPEELAGLTSRATNPDAALNSWISGALTKHVKHRMASPEDEIRQLADQGITHARIATFPEEGDTAAYLKQWRKDAGENGGGLATTTPGKAWEQRSDMAIGSTPAGSRWGHAATMQNPWLSKVAPETPVYESMFDMSSDLGFDHLTDVISNKLASGELRPENLNRLSVADAVRLAHQSNLDATKKAEQATQEALKGNLAQTATKTYENGYKWVQLPDTAAAPENKDLVKKIGEQGGWCTQEDWAALNYGSNGNQLHVLLGPDGRPHAQVQVQTKLPGLEASDRGDADEQFNRALDLAEAAGVNTDNPENVRPFLEQARKETMPPSIQQIKPMENDWDSARVKSFTAKDPEYQNTITPMLQDFVKSGDWSDVQDLHNTGLRASKNVFNSTETKALQDRGIELSPYLTADEIEAHQATFPGYANSADPQNFAAGGHVLNWPFQPPHSGYNEPAWPFEEAA